METWFLVGVLLGVVTQGTSLPAPGFVIIQRTKVLRGGNNLQKIMQITPKVISALFGTLANHWAVSSEMSDEGKRKYRIAIQDALNALAPIFEEIPCDSARAQLLVGCIAKLAPTSDEIPVTTGELLRFLSHVVAAPCDHIFKKLLPEEAQNLVKGFADKLIQEVDLAAFTTDNQTALVFVLACYYFSNKMNVEVMSIMRAKQSNENSSWRN